ncbi:hypothetical protein ET495_03885 [Xylanimonas allomyrinae]|uniref:Inner membrane protein n=1 Tax=Xylanimonas allomyrinae TaxID=2509459 RepID=A0A4P6EJ83_9MICO|nr:YgjV family protein [Xylanimonas allomyrinae]QAY62534.1 hypothetical protein ET495_03885 [Xylanimonas allomyrinae]
MELLGMPIDVGLERFVLAQAFGLLTLVFNFWSYQMEDQRKYFLRFTIGSAFWLAMFLTMGAQVPVILVAVFSTLRGIVFWWALGVDSPWRRMLARRVMYTTLAIAFVSAAVAIPGARPETRPLQVLLLLAVVLFVVGQYLPGVYLVRVFATVYAVAVLLLNTPLDTFNPVGIVIELNNLVAIAVFFVLLSRRRRERARLAAVPPKALALGTPVAA